MSAKNANASAGMSARTAAAIEFTIIGFCIIALVLIFQPFSLLLYSIGCGLVVLGALAFNLVPLAAPGVPLRSVVMAGVVVIVLLFVIVGLAILSAWLYGVYFVKPVGG
ncbi:MAG TPA: hypothetical protein VFK86_06685 [Bauldia sp.]|nr:hypothetical protein [Bauldia sp.]